MRSRNEPPRPRTEGRSVWIIPKSLLSAFAQAPECSTSAAMPPSNTSESIPVLWVMSSGTPTPRPASWPGWKKRAWSPRLFGQAISNPATCDAFMDWWTSELRASRALPSQPPASGKESTTTAGSCPPSWKCFARLEPDSSFSKMSVGSCQQMLDGSLEKFTGSWPGSGTMRNGSLYERPMWAPTTNATASSSWPSVRAEDSESCGNHPGATDSLNAIAKTWPTPRATESTESTETQQARAARGTKASRNLSADTTLWATPNTPSGGPNTKSTPTHTGGLDLDGQVVNWPTPAARDHKGSPTELTRPDGKSRLDQLDRVAENFSPPAPAIHDGPTSSETSRGSRLPSPQGVSVYGGTTRPDLSKRMRLNPAFVNFLMGWPWWWTRPEPISYASQETVLWRYKLASHLRSLLGD